MKALWIGNAEYFPSATKSRYISPPETDVHGNIFGRYPNIWGVRFNISDAHRNISDAHRTISDVHATILDVHATISDVNVSFSPMRAQLPDVLANIPGMRRNFPGRLANDFPPPHVVFWQARPFFKRARLFSGVHVEIAQTREENS